MTWEKQGLILTPNTYKWWSKSHCSVPCPLLMDSKTLRDLLLNSSCKEKQRK